MKKNVFCTILLMCILVSCSQNIEDFFEKKGSAITKESQKWTIMLYMAADNNLEAEALADLNALEFLNIPSSVSILCLLDRSNAHDASDGNWADTRLYEISKDPYGENGIIISKRLSSQELSLSNDRATELNLADRNILKNFLRYTYTHYESQKYALFLWGHSSGWKSLFVDDYSNATMPIKDVNTAIRSAFDGQEHQVLDIFVVDTSFGAILETAWELRDSCTYFCGFAGIGTSPGINYKSLLSFFFASDRETEDLLNSLSRENALSIIETNYMDDIVKAFNHFTNLVSLCIVDSNTQLYMKNFLLTTVDSYLSYPLPSDKFLCIYDFCKEVESNVSSLTHDMVLQTDICNASRILCNALEKAIRTTENGTETIPKLSLFVTTIEDGYIPKNTFDFCYINDVWRNEKIDFISDCVYWVPSESKNTSILDKTFLSVY